MSTLDELNKRVNEFIEKHNKLDSKLNLIIKKYLDLEKKYTTSYTINNKCECEFYAPLIKNGECRFCHGY